MIYFELYFVLHKIKTSYILEGIFNMFHMYKKVPSHPYLCTPKDMSMCSPLVYSSKIQEFVKFTCLQQKTL